MQLGNIDLNLLVALEALLRDFEHRCGLNRSRGAEDVDVATLRTAAEETGHLLTVEDHWPEGGLGDAVAGALADSGLAPRLRRLAVSRMPGSAAPEEQLHAAGIDADAIVAAVRELLG